jgi:nitronate monooxygenase
MLTELPGVRFPLIQAPMAGVQGVDLALAVGSAGALGSLPCAMLGVDALREALTRIQAQGACVNINFFCHQPPKPDAARDAAWRAALQPYYREHGIDTAQQSVQAPLRAPFSDAMADLLAQFQPAVVSFHFGLPTPALLARVRGWGAKVLVSATTVDEAVWLESQGADAIIAQGLEAGGHRGMFLTEDVSTQVGTLALVRQVVRAVRLPVIAAGGVADAAGVAAAMALGAAGVQVGTAYLLCPEATTGAGHRAALRSDAARHTALTRVFSGRPARSIVNRLMREIADDGRIVPAFPLAGAALAPLRQAAERAGRDDFTPLWSGQNASGCAAIPAAQLTQALARGFDRAAAG